MVGDCCGGGGLLLWWGTASVMDCLCSIVPFLKTFEFFKNFCVTWVYLNPASLNMILRIYMSLNILFTSRVVSLGHLPKGLTFQSLGCAYCSFELVAVVGSVTCAPTVLRQDVDRLIKLSTYAVTSSSSRE